MRFGAISPKASPKVVPMVNAFVQRLDTVLPWDVAAIDATARIRVELMRLGTPISQNDASPKLAQSKLLWVDLCFQRYTSRKLTDWVYF